MRFGFCQLSPSDVMANIIALVQKKWAKLNVATKLIEMPTHLDGQKSYDGSSAKIFSLYASKVFKMLFYF